MSVSVQVGSWKKKDTHETGEFQVDALEVILHEKYQENSETEYDYALLRGLYRLERLFQKLISFYSFMAI